MLHIRYPVVRWTANLSLSLSPHTHATHLLVFAPERVLPPARADAEHAVEGLARGREADGLHGGAQFRRAFQDEQGNVVVDVPRVVVGVHEDLTHTDFLVDYRLRRVLEVPLAESDNDVVRLFAVALEGRRNISKDQSGLVSSRDWSDFSVI